MSISPAQPQKLLGTTTATLLVIANVVGTGVFSATGILLQHVHSPAALLLVWCVGGFLSLCGALAYSELTCMYRANGGEYLLLSRIFHPALGFIAGCITFFVGFAAPVAAAALAFSSYFAALVPGIMPLLTAWTLVVVMSGIQIVKVSLASRTQDFLTIGKVALMLVFIVGGYLHGHPEYLHDTGHHSLTKELVSPGFALGIVFVAFPYNGWNAVTYLAGEFRNVSRSLPIALISGTTIIVLLYVGLNLVFMMSMPTEKLRGVVEVGHIAAMHLYGGQAGRILSATIALGLVSTVGAMIMTGPRVYEAMGYDYRMLGFLTFRMRDGGPAIAIALQAAATLLMIVTASFDSILAYSGFLMSVSALVTVLGVFYMRIKAPEWPRPYRTWGYPFTPLLYVAATTWSIVNTIILKPQAAFAGLMTVIAGFLLYLVVKPSRTLPELDSDNTIVDADIPAANLEYT